MLIKQPIAVKPNLSTIANPSIWLKRFHNLPLKRKQITALAACQLIPILGLSIGSTLVLTNSLRTQLRAQARSEVAVVETNYNIKVDQMGFGSRGQSDNTAIVDAAKLHQRKEALSTNVQDQVKQILKNEVKVRNIEYATLVGKDLQIVVNANADRAKETVTESALVRLIQTALKENRQLKASEIVSWDELQKEGAPLPEGIAPQEALIRYVVMPVKDPDTQEVIGALVFGDIVNGKLAIVENTQNAFSGGYSAIYLRRPNGEFAIATSQLQNDASQPQFGVALSNASILTEAASAKGATVTGHSSIGGQTYTLAAKALPNSVMDAPEAAAMPNDRAIAFLVRGTPETSLNRLLGSSFQQEFFVLLASLGLIAAWSALFRQTVLKPIENLHQTTERFTEGDRTVRAEIASQDEVGQLAIAFNQMADQINTSETTLVKEAIDQERQVREAQSVSDITVKMRQSLHSDDILQTALDEIRKFLTVDRTIIYQFDQASTNGIVVAESISNVTDSVLNRAIADLLGLNQIEQYQNQMFWLTNDAEADEINSQYRQNLKELQTRAEIVVPLNRNGKLVGLLCAQTLNSTSSIARSWQASDLRFLSQIAVQLGYALDQAQMLQERQEALQESEVLKESLQQHIIQLLGEVQGVARGDLTVRASVVSGDIGTVAGSFNAIVESLRQIVLQVQQSATQVHSLLNENEGSVRQLSDESLQQTYETTRILNSVEQMAQSVQTVTERARQTADVAQSASTAAQMGETAMESSVRSIMTLRSTLEGATQTVKHLGESSQQIARIVSLIQELAAQTDVLAINASLEASRAGEQGRGFAIVASEIGELASRSATAAREVEKIVEAIQQQTHGIVDVMGQSAVQVVDSAHSVKNSKQSLVHIVHLSTQIDELVKSVVEAMDSQMQTTHSVTDLVKDVAQVSTRTSNSSRQVSTALRQTVAVAEELRRSVEVFKVNASSAAP